MKVQNQHLSALGVGVVLEMEGGNGLLKAWGLKLLTTV